MGNFLFSLTMLVGAGAAVILFLYQVIAWSV